MVGAKQATREGRDPSFQPSILPSSSNNALLPAAGRGGSVLGWPTPPQPSPRSPQRLCADKAARLHDRWARSRPGSLVGMATGTRNPMGFCSIRVRA